MRKFALLSLFLIVSISSIAQKIDKDWGKWWSGYIGHDKMDYVGTQGKFSIYETKDRYTQIYGLYVVRGPLFWFANDNLVMITYNIHPAERDGILASLLNQFGAYQDYGSDETGISYSWFDTKSEMVLLISSDIVIAFHKAGKP
jgi:hypothetical protein